MAASTSKKTTRTKVKRGTAKKRTTGKGSAKRPAAAGRGDKSVEAYRDSLERSVTLSREWLQDVFDDAVKRGRMTRKDANEIVSSLLARGRKGSEDLAKDLERLLAQARTDIETAANQAWADIETRTGRARKRVSAEAGRARKRAAGTAGRVGRTARDAGDSPLAQADRLRRRAGVGSFPITAYDELTATQVKSRLSDLGKPELRKVRTYEKNNKARKGVLDAIEKKLVA